MIGLLLSCATDTGKLAESAGEDSAPLDSVDSAVDSAPIDLDGDGFNVSVDCDDANADVHPAGTEVCNGIDDDCDEQIDEGSLYADLDEDGYGSDTLVEGTLCPGEGLASRADDCDDTDATVYPGAPERCDGGVDNNCNGTFDCGFETEALWRYTEEEGVEHGDGGALSMGDVDGDGVSDLLIGGAAGYFENTWFVADGQIHILISNPARGAADLSLTDDADWTISGETGEALAVSATFIRDLDGDGCAELLVAAMGRYSAWLLTGSALTSAPSTALMTSVADQEIHDEGEVGQTGKFVSEGGDMDGDGTIDLAIASAARVRVLPFDVATAYRNMDDGATIFSTEYMFGDALASVGDVDGDGLEDLVIGGAEGEDQRGGAWLFLGGTLTWGGSVSTEDADLQIGGAERELVGRAAAGGDLDGDGRADWVFSSYGERTTEEDGLIYLLTDTPAVVGTSIEAASLTTRIRGAVANKLSVGDFDGDERPDIALRAQSADVPTVHVVASVDLPAEGTLELSDVATEFAPTGTDRVSSICMSADATGDGLVDLLIGDGGWPDGDDRGAAWLVPGR